MCRCTERPGEPIGEIERRIGEYVAELVPDGATLQLGIGAIPAATALALTDHRDLGVHTEMFTDGIVDLVEAGVITGVRKERNRDKIVTAFMMGTNRLYTFVNDNPMIEMRLSTSPTTPMSSARSAGWSRSTRRSRWT
jgi:acyl-CoA hydrolase